jgi:DNA gyrase/topoisomerase IV subunit B
MEKTAVEWLIGRFHYEGFIGTYCSEEQIKSKRQLMIEIIDQAKEMEKQQIIDFAIWFNYTNTEYLSYEQIIEQYYNEKFKQQ